MKKAAEAQFRTFYDSYYDSVYRFARRRTSRDRAIDVTTETFVVAWRRFSSIREPALPWLYRVARNHLRNAARAAARDKVVAIGQVDPGASDEVESAVLGAAGLREAFANLRDTDREVLMLVAWDGLASDEAAQVLGCSSAAFSVKLHRARQRLLAAEAQHSSTVGSSS